MSPTWIQVNGGDILAGRNFTPIEYAAGARVAVINDKLAESLFPGRDPIGKTDQDLRPALRGGRAARRGGLALQQRRRAAAGDPAHDLHQGGGLREGLDGDRRGPDRRRPPSLEAQDQVTAALRSAARPPARRRRTTSRS